MTIYLEPYIAREAQERQGFHNYSLGTGERMCHGLVVRQDWTDGFNFFRFFFTWLSNVWEHFVPNIFFFFACESCTLASVAQLAVVTVFGKHPVFGNFQTFPERQPTTPTE